MSEITISIEQYNLLYGKALAFDNIVDAIERNIDRNEVYPVNEKEILLLTGTNKQSQGEAREVCTGIYSGGGGCEPCRRSD